MLEEANILLHIGHFYLFLLKCTAKCLLRLAF